MLDNFIQLGTKIPATFSFFLDWSSAIMIILAGTKPEHLNMLEGGIIAKLLDEKWVTFAKVCISKLKILYLWILFFCKI